jgi:hypothetical protein
VLSVQEIDFGMGTVGGAPKLAGKLIVQESSSVASVVSVAALAVRDGAGAALRKTTKTDSRAAKCSGTVVNPNSVA